MRLFSRSPQALLPSDYGEHLAVWGRSEYAKDLSAMRSVTVVARVQLLVSQDPALADALLQEISTAALRTGGWALYGGVQALHAFLPMRYDTPQRRALEEAFQQFRESGGR